jgi:hypothetical protein
VPPALLSRATSLTSMAQQLSQAAGVAAALFLHLILLLHGGPRLVAADFYPVFVMIAVISLASVPSPS